MDHLKINSFLQKSDHNLILNNYEILNISDDINLIIYYLNKYKVRIIIRKFFNFNIGWKKQIILKLYSEDNKYFEDINIGSSTKNWKIFNYNTKIMISKKENKHLKIPKIIHQTYKNNKYHNICHYNAIQSLIDFNPDFDYKFYNDYDCRDYIKINFDNKILDSYDLLYPCAYKADFFRYLIIFKYGGIYIDNKYIVRKSFQSVINSYDENLFCYDISKDLLFNSIIISKSNDGKFKLLIDRIINNIKYNFYGKCPLHPTGPRLFYEFFKNNNIKLRHVKKEPKNYYLNCYIEDQNNNKLLNTYYDGYYNKKDHRNKMINDYDYCYNNKLIYLKEFINIEEYKFSILIDKKINFQIILLNKNTEKITIQISIQGILFRNIKNKYKFIIINDVNHKFIEYNLSDVYNKVIDVRI